MTSVHSVHTNNGEGEFFPPQIYHLGPRWKQEANGCHRCIRNEFSKWVGIHEILQLNGMSKIWQKHGFDLGQPYPKNQKNKTKKKRHESIGSLRGDSGTWGGGMTLHDKRTQRTHKQWRGRIFSPPNISFGTLVEARSKRMPSLHPE